MIDHENNRDIGRNLVWPYATQVPLSLLSSESIFETPQYLLLSEKSSEIVQAFLKEYYEEDLTEIDSPFPRFDSTMRFPKLDEMTFDVGGRKMKGYEVAEHNFRELSRAGVARWDRAIRELLLSSGLKEIRRHLQEDSLVIATVGCEGGYGIREVAQVFSRLQLPVTMYAVDPRSLPDMESYKDLYNQSNFSLFLNLQDPRQIRWTQVQPDVVILPRYFMANSVSYNAWKETIAQIAEANPSIIIAGFPQVETIIRDPLILRDVKYLMYEKGQISSLDEVNSPTMGMEMQERSILSGLLTYFGYQKKAIKVFPDDLFVPHNIYGASMVDSQNNRQNLIPLDPYSILTVHQELFDSIV